MIKRTLGWVVGGVLIASGTLLAHHSLAATYDIRKESTLTGVVTKVAFTNPHGALSLEVKNPNGTKTEWILTTGSANVLAGLGFDSKTIKAGDAVTVNIYGSRTGKPVGFMRRITLADKRQFEFEAN
jgi:DNA/RNA endonuclease YhcR with UshA esterase domain